MYIKSISKIQWSSFIAPFSKPVWICILIWIILISLTKYFILRLNKYQRNPVNVILSVLKSLCYQSDCISLSPASVYIVHLTPYILGIVFIQYYSGVLLSYLALKETYSPFKNIEEVAKDGSYKIFLWENGYIYYYFTTDEGEIAKLLRNQGLLQPVKDEATTLPLLCNTSSITMQTTLDYKIEENCEISEIPEAISVQSSGILVWKGFPYESVFTKLMKRIQFAGLIKIKQKNRIIPYENAQESNSLSLKTLFPIFFLYSSFILISLIIFVLELLHKGEKSKLQKLALR